MNFTEKTQLTIEYNKIIDMLVRCCSTEGAQHLARTLVPSDDIVVIRRRQTRTTDARRLVDAKGYPGIDASDDVPEAADRADKGATLSTKELLHIASNLRSVHACIDYNTENHIFDSSLDEFFGRLLDNQTLERKISRIILGEDFISDDASPKLRDIRRAIRNANSKIKESLLSYITGNKQRALQDNIVTVRDGRYVIPVKNEYKNDIKGIIHDTSSTGSTVFIEPIAVVDANNELRTLEIQETREIERILSELSSDVGNFAASIRSNYYTMIELALYFGLARFSETICGVEPEIGEDDVISLKRARHPLIDKEKVVPINVNLGSDFDTLIITGPNTGGKTVTLKTLGLFVAMAQAGMHIPADPGSHIGVRDAILVDIGDEQSIEQNLSTFSSHMVNVAKILQNLTEKSLVLFDELGAGTDPIEGAALAVSILEKSKGAGALTCATTHYTELKMYALDSERVCNASCEFDVDTLKPTYKLNIGAPGKSNAFAISRKLGIEEDVISRAEELVKEDNQNFERVLSELEKTRSEMEKAKDETEAMKRDYEIFKRESEIKIKKKTEEASKQIEKDRAKAKELLDSARINSEFVWKQLEEVKKKQNQKEFAEQLEKARQQVREQLKRADDHYTKMTFDEISLEDEYKLKRPLVKGDKIFIVPYKAEGEVVTVLSDSQIEVKAGVFRGKVNVKDIRLMEDLKMKAQPKEQSKSKVQRGGITSFKVELDVRGRYSDDAWFEVDRYLDEAVLAGVDIVRIVHGKGTGALRVALHKYFKTDPRIESFRLGSVGEGDSGVTVITLK